MSFRAPEGCRTSKQHQGDIYYSTFTCATTNVAVERTGRPYKSHYSQRNRHRHQREKNGTEFSLSFWLGASPQRLRTVRHQPLGLGISPDRSIAEPDKVQRVQSTQRQHRRPRLPSLRMARLRRNLLILLEPRIQRIIRPHPLVTETNQAPANGRTPPVDRSVPAAPDAGQHPRRRG